jgi:RNA polymerase sigma-70 factor (sigma-B/F/G subfamily)
VAFQPSHEQIERSTKTHELLVAAAASDSDEERRRLHGEAVLLNMEVAESIAKRYAHRGEPLEDLVQVACVGLTKAAQGFDPQRGHDFLSYAVPSIAGEVKRYFRDHGWTIRPPRRIQEVRQQISGAVAELSQELGRSPRPSELAKRVGVDAGDIEEALATEDAYAPASLDERGPHDDGLALVESLSYDDTDLARMEALATLGPAVQRLDVRQRHILYLRFFKGWKQREIAEELGVSQMQVSRLLSRILASLRTELEDPAVLADAPDVRSAARGA